MLTGRVSDTDVTGTDWSAREIDLIVADYFDTFRKEIASQTVNKGRAQSRDAGVDETVARLDRVQASEHQRRP
jgi:hypothetical protein